MNYYQPLASKHIAKSQKASAKTKTWQRAYLPSPRGRKKPSRQQLILFMPRLVAFMKGEW